MAERKAKTAADVNTEEDPPAHSREELEEMMSPKAIERENEEVERLRAIVEKARADNKSTIADLAKINIEEDPKVMTREELEAMMSLKALERDRERDERIRAAMEKARADKSTLDLTKINTEEDPPARSDEELDAMISPEAMERRRAWREGLDAMLTPEGQEIMRELDKKLADRAAQARADWDRDQ